MIVFACLAATEWELAALPKDPSAASTLPSQVRPHIQPGVMQGSPLDGDPPGVRDPCCQGRDSVSRRLGGVAVLLAATPPRFPQQLTHLHPFVWVTGAVLVAVMAIRVRVGNESKSRGA